MWLASCHVGGHLYSCMGGSSVKKSQKSASREAPKAQVPSPAQPCYERVSVSERAWVGAVENGGNEVWEAVGRPGPVGPQGPWGLSERRTVGGGQGRVFVSLADVWRLKLGTKMEARKPDGRLLQWFKQKMMAAWTRVIEDEGVRSWSRRDSGEWSWSRILFPCLGIGAA